MNATIKELKRKIDLKKQIWSLLIEEIDELQDKLALAEVEQDEKPCRVWVLDSSSPTSTGGTDEGIGKAGDDNVPS